MQSILNPYFLFDGQAREAMEFYRHVFGGTLTVNTFKEGGMTTGPEDENKIMHAMLVVGNGMNLMASDAPPEVPHNPGNNVAVSLSGDDEEELRGYWDRLAEGATIVVPLDRAPWGDVYGALTDRFGINWMVDIGPQS